MPRRCGIATFTTHLQNAVKSIHPDIETSIIAMTDQEKAYAYPDAVTFSIRDTVLKDYALAADYINDNKYDAVCLQHEFGIFGGSAGSHILELLKHLNVPVITTLHTILTHPNLDQQRVFEQVIKLSSRVIAMSEKGKLLLQTVYNISPDKIDLIPHGIPDVAFTEPNEAKFKMGYAGRPVILTFGLLSPNKGIEVMIDAMPTILQKTPDAIYIVLGATHPHMVRDHGEAYRDSLLKRANALGVHNNIVFFDQFVDQAMLLDFIAMCDVYVTPYLNEAQMTSGTLAYSFGIGKAVVSTPYWHATELLADGKGILVPFGDSVSMAVAISGLLTDDTYRLEVRTRAYTSSRSMTWQNTAQLYLAVFNKSQQYRKLRVIAGNSVENYTRETLTPPDLHYTHLYAMCDNTGIIQHAVYNVADRSHGYCVDDNARALLLSCSLNIQGELPLSDTLTARFAAFVQHAWNPDTKRFRNFMSYDRRWLEHIGSEDSHGRTLWSLGACARHDTSASRKLWAADLFAQALPTVNVFSSPRAWAFTLLGLHSYCEARPHDVMAKDIRYTLVSKLMSALSATATEGWIWFEKGLSYDNARLSQALIVTGVATGTTAHIKAGLRTLRWLMGIQTTSTDLFRPVGTAGFNNYDNQPPEKFDQQPVDATATISACLEAWRATGKEEWKIDAGKAFAWFFGYNDLASSLADVETGGCRDGLHPDRMNENCGAESVLCYLFSVAEIRQLARSHGQVIKPLSANDFLRQTARGLNPMRRGYSVNNAVFEPSGAFSAPRSDPSGRSAI